MLLLFVVVGYTAVGVELCVCRDRRETAHKYVMRVPGPQSSTLEKMAHSREGGSQHKENPHRKADTSS